ncbi:hypothetical protein [Legionella shakespearei]|uniref:Transmembrane protein n=2 Tax=Legionella shakespearei TaxID=45075 RepID=A0A0W0YM91_9GAMM|nr:hypothetical protein [Legionella shakespearei]KTD57710.1 hypothetical protein Lsha_2551 [Legionella shakespearei DSM 23087]
MFHSLSKFNPLFSFILFAACLLGTNFLEINLLHTEWGDFAANSLLIQDAKSFKLLTGHYSFHGFNHPGPALLYVLALGEYIFFDLLHWVSSPYSGQLIAVALYNAFWIMLLFELLNKILYSMRLSALTLSLFLICTVFIDFKFYYNPWPPFLFFFPFTVFLLSITLTQESRIDALKSLALSMGFLINGYASFIALLSLMFVMALTYNYLFYDDEVKILSKKYFVLYKKNLLIALGIFLTFLIPLFIRTFKDFPGPLAEYIRYGRDNVPHTLIESLQFVGYYWQGLAQLSLGIFTALAGVFFFRSYAGKNTCFSHLSSLCVTIIFATLSTLYYAKCGVKFLYGYYVAFFYYSVPILFIATFIAMTLRKLNKRLINILIILLTFSTLCQLSLHPVKNTPDSNDYQPDIIKLYELLNHKTEHGRLALNFNYGHKGLELWSGVIALFNYAKRQHNDLFCINSHWSISFTKAAKCTTFESIHNRHVFIQHAEISSPDKLLGKAKDIAIYNMDRLNLNKINRISISRLLASPDKNVLEEGWSPLEFNYVWTERKRASMVFALDTYFSGHIGLELVANLPDFDFVQEVAFYANGQHIKTAYFSFADNRKLVMLPISNVNKQLHLELEVKRLVPLASANSNQNKRKVGVALFALVVSH